LGLGSGSALQSTGDLANTRRYRVSVLPLSRLTLDEA